MERDLDVIFYLSVVCKQLNIQFMWDVQYTVNQILGEDPYISIQDLPLIVEPSNMPNTKQMVHMLAQKGYQPKFISEYLGIKPPSVSVHLKTKPKTYRNKHLEFKRLEANIAEAEKTGDYHFP